MLAASAVSLTQWIIAIASLSSAIIALALAFGLKEWIFRPKIRLLLRRRGEPDDVSDRVVTKRIDTGETTAFVRLRLENRGRSTARNVGVFVLQVHRWDDDARRWLRTRPELDGRLLSPSNQLPDDPDTVDVFPYSDRIIDLASVGYGKKADSGSPIFIEIGHPWPPNEANVLEPGVWQLETLVCGDNIHALRYFLTVTFDGRWHEDESAHVWERFVVEGPSPLPFRDGRRSR
jgi:hypothetical protein